MKTANDNLHNPAASAYDQTIREEVDEYNRRFPGIPGFSKLDPNLFKAQLLTETGPANPQWLTLPAQIGKPGDQAYGVLQRHEQRSFFVMSQGLQRDIATKPITDPVLNVRAAIAYVLTRAAHSRLVSRRDPTDTSERKHIVKRGEVVEAITRREHTTVSELYADNPWAANGINEGQTLTFYRASMVPEIHEFDKIDVQFIAKQYNNLKRDPYYADKIAYIFERIQ